MTRLITTERWRALARSLAVEEAALRAIADVESAGTGFLPPPSDRPKVLFEGHAFHRLTQGRFDDTNPTLSYRTWTRKYYASSLAGEWKRLDRACELDRQAALQSASWGAFQIMGFNYGLCGFEDVEAFVDTQRRDAEGQLECFARFIARDRFLAALRRHRWADFARAYNGPAFARNKYDEKLAAAYRRYSAAPAGGRRRATRRATTEGGRPPGRPEFAVPPSPRHQPFRRPVRPDPIDLRDWMYQPNVAIAPPPSTMPHDPCATTHQGATSACTGFALATIIEYLHDRGERPVEPVSGFMLYSMARRYDEWTDNDEVDEGSSLRGALKGWARHGASAARLWKTLEMPEATNEPSTDWWLDAVKRPLGAYYRLKPDMLSDMHIALVEAGVIYASALTHAGWDALVGQQTLPAPVDIDEIPIIDCRPGLRDGGHAFTIVGYTEKGFVIQNSWGPAWGRGGFAILTYSDWRQNAMDCWVVQLGVVTTEHEHVAAAGTLRVDEQSGRVQLSTSSHLADHEVSPFVLSLQPGGRLSDRGRFRTNPDDLRALVDFHLPEACQRWGIDGDGTVDVALYAYSGLESEEDAARAARRWVPLLYSNRVLPVFLLWSTGALRGVLHLVEHAVAATGNVAVGTSWPRPDPRDADWYDERIEGLTRRPGNRRWEDLQEDATDVSRTADAAVRRLFRMIRQRTRRKGCPAVRLHLIGHSTGALVETALATHALKSKLDLGTLSFLAPAVSVETFDTLIGDAIVEHGIRVLVAHLTDAAERGDSSCAPYGRSLLYLVSRAFERRVGTPLLGMEKHLVPALVAHEWGGAVTRLLSPGAAYRRGDQLTVATSHQGIDADDAVMDAVVRHIRGRAVSGAVVRPLS